MLKAAAATAAAAGDPVLSGLCVYVAQDCTVYRQDVRDLCKKRSAQLLQQQNRRLVDDKEDFSFLEPPSASDYDPSDMVPTEAVDRRSGARWW